MIAPNVLQAMTSLFIYDDVTIVRKTKAATDDSTPPLNEDDYPGAADADYGDRQRRDL